MDFEGEGGEEASGVLWREEGVWIKGARWWFGWCEVRISWGW